MRIAYFQFTKNESWSLEEGIVKTGSFSIDKGVGIRAVAGDKTAFSYSDDISVSALEEAAKTTRTIGRHGEGTVKLASSINPVGNHSLYVTDNRFRQSVRQKRWHYWKRWKNWPRQQIPRIVQVMAGLAGEFDVVLVARSDGTLAADVRPLIRLSVTVIAEENGRREIGTSGGGGRFGYAYFTDEIVRQYVHDATRSALVNLSARPAPAGSMTVVLGSGWPGVLLHEAIGHGLEGDFNRKGSSAFSGRLGEKVAADGITVVDDGSIANRRGSLNMDDEGISDTKYRVDRERCFYEGLFSRI